MLPIENTTISIYIPGCYNVVDTLFMGYGLVAIEHALVDGVPETLAKV